jgi:hypothetical protein
MKPVEMMSLVVFTVVRCDGRAIEGAPDQMPVIVVSSTRMEPLRMTSKDSVAWDQDMIVPPVKSVAA